MEHESEVILAYYIIDQLLINKSTRATFSGLAASEASPSAFSPIVVSHMQQYSFDGEDLDESTRSLMREAGKDKDFVHYVNFFAIFKKTLAGSGHNYGLSITSTKLLWRLRHNETLGLWRVGSMW